MTARTYESLSDNFDLVINENNFHRIAQRNAETFWNYKHNYIVHILNTNPKEIDVENDLTIKETLLKEKEELKIKLPSKLIEKLIHF